MNKWKKHRTVKEFDNSDNLANGLLKIFSVPMGIRMPEEDEDIMLSLMQF